MVTPYAPSRDGIAAYATQSVAALRRAGHEVEVLSPGPSAAHHHLDLRGPRGVLALGRRMRAYDKVIIQFHPDIFFGVPIRPIDLIATSAALAAAFRGAADVEVRVHEVDYRWGHGQSPAAKAFRAVWRAATRIAVHTELERTRFAAAFGVPVSKIDVVSHGADFVRKTEHGRASARSSLGLPAEAFIFLAIGFLQPHKGFDRAMRSFAASGLQDEGARLEVVGSQRVDENEVSAHVVELEEFAAANAGIGLRREYVSDEHFDRWLVAADVLVLPYRHIWSSGVLERALLYGRPIIATRVGGIAQQGEACTRLVTLIDEGADVESGLTAEMRRAAGGRSSVGRGNDAHSPRWSATDRTSIQEEIRARAAVRRGPRRPAQTKQSKTSDVMERAATVRRLQPLGLPAPSSTRISIRWAKLVVAKLTEWQIVPIVEQLNGLRAATIRALEQECGPVHRRDGSESD